MISYSIKKTLEKAGKAFVVAGIGGVIAYFSGLEPTTTIVLTITILTAVFNYLKHN